MHSTQVEITVVVPVYNGEKTIAKCLDSLINQDLHASNFHIIVVDNGSRDNTKNIIMNYEDNISILHESFRGPAAARNCGIRSCSSAIVAFIDADCVADSSWLRNLVCHFENQDVSIVGGQILSASKMNQIQIFGEQIHDHKKAIEICTPPYFITMNIAIRHSILDKVGLFDKNFRRGEDVDLAWRLVNAGYSFLYTADSIIYHHNESTLPGLFREGFQHGFYAVQLLKRHEVFLKKLNGQRKIMSNLQRATSHFKKMVLGNEKTKKEFYLTIFNTGKLLGSTLGSIRFRYLQF